MVRAHHRNPATLFADVPEAVRSDSNSETRTFYTRFTKPVGATGLEPATFRPPRIAQPTSTKIPKPLGFMRCNVTQTFRQLIPNSPFIALIASIAEVYRGRMTTSAKNSCSQSGNDRWLLTQLPLGRIKATVRC